MKIIRKAKQFQAELEGCRKKGKTIGFVPTMGALHAGHLALVKAARKNNQVTAVSIFVNPTQFGPQEDFKKYPRVFGKDSELLRAAGVDYLFSPAISEIYPEGASVGIHFQNAPFIQTLCGRFRPGHFEGVATVVTKLFALSGACRAYFGAKDFQQTVVIRHLVRDLLLPIQVAVCPTLREKDGLAMSSRNRYLNSKERSQAIMISQVLFNLKSSLEKGKVASLDFDFLKKQAIVRLKQSGLKVQYFEFVDPETMQRVKPTQSSLLVATACFVGKTRLIDNVIIHVPQGNKKEKV